MMYESVSETKQNPTELSPEARLESLVEATGYGTLTDCQDAYDRWDAKLKGYIAAGQPERPAANVARKRLAELEPIIKLAAEINASTSLQNDDEDTDMVEANEADVDMLPLPEDEVLAEVIANEADVDMTSLPEEISIEATESHSVVDQSTMIDEQVNEATLPIQPSYLDPILQRFVKIHENTQSKAIDDIVKEHVLLAQRMPKCAERSLLALLIYSQYEEVRNSQDKPDLLEPFLSEEEVQSIYAELCKELANESLLDKHSKKLLEKIVKPLKISFNAFDLTSKCAGLLSYIRPLNLDLMLSLIDSALTAADKIYDKDIIQFLGGTGTGKSTTIHFLAGSKLHETNVNDLFHLEPTDVLFPELASFVSQPEKRSETRIINAATIDLSKIDAERNGEVTLCDSPGFGDTLGAEVDIANGIGVVRALKGCRSVKPVILVSASSIGDRFEGLERLATILAALMPDLQAALPSFSYLFTKFKKGDKRNIIGQLKSKKRALTIKQRANRGLVALFDDMLKKAEEQICILSPLSDDPFEVLDILNKRPPIQNPEEKFQDFATPDSMAELNEQLHKHKASIEKAIERGDVPLIVFKMQQLATLNKQLELHESQMHYQSCIRNISDLIENLQNQIAFRLEICSNPGNTHVESDIIDCSQRMKELYAFEPVRIGHLSHLSNLQSYVILQIYQLQKQLFSRIEEATQQSETPHLSVSVNLDKMHMIANIFAETFSDIPQASELIQNLQQGYKQACTLIQNQFSVCKDLVRAAFDSEDLSEYVVKMEHLESMAQYYQKHASEVSMATIITELTSLLAQKINAALEETKTLLNSESLPSDTQTADAILARFSWVQKACKTPGIFKYYSEEQFETIIKELEHTIQNYFITLKQQQIDIWNEQKQQNMFEELSKTITLFDHYRQNPTIAYVTNQSYQASIKQIQHYLQTVKEEAQQDAKLLKDSQLGTPLEIDYEKMITAMQLLRSAMIFKSHPEQIYQNEYETILNYVQDYFEAAQFQLKNSVPTLDTIEILPAYMQLISQLNGIKPLEQYFSHQETSIDELVSYFSRYIQTWFATIHTKMIEEQRIPNAEKLFQYVACLHLTANKLSQECNEHNQKIQQDIETLYQAWFEDKMSFALVVKHNLLSLNTAQTVNEAKSLVNFLINTMGIKNIYSRLQVLIQENESTPFIENIFIKKPEELLNAWFADSTDNILYQHMQMLLAEADKIEQGQLNDKMNHHFEIASQLKALDRYLPFELTYSQVISRLETAMRTQSLSLINELKIFISTEEYAKFLARYQEIQANNPNLLEEFSEPKQLLVDSISTQLQEVNKNLTELVVTESTMVSFNFIIQSIAKIKQAIAVIEAIEPEQHIALKDEMLQQEQLLTQKVDDYEKLLDEQFESPRFIKIETHIASLAQLLVGLSAQMGDLQNRMAVILEKMLHKRQSILDDKIAYYSSLAFADYAQNQPVRFIQSLQDAAETNSIYQDAIDQVSDAIKTKMKEALEQAKNASDPIKEEANVNEMLGIKSYLPDGFDDTFFDELSKVQEQIKQCYEQLKQTLQENLTTGQMQKLVDEMSEKIQQKEIDAALFLNNAMQEAIKQKFTDIMQALSDGDVKQFLEKMIHDFDDWIYYQDALDKINKVDDTVAKKFNSNYVKSIINKVVDVIFDRVDNITACILSTVSEENSLSMCLKQIEENFQQLSAMALYFYANEESHLYQLLHVKNDALFQQIGQAFSQISQVLQHHQTRFTEALKSNDVSELGACLDNAQKHALLLENIFEMSQKEVVKTKLAAFYENMNGLLSYAKLKEKLSLYILSLQKQLHVGFLSNNALNNKDQSQQNDFYKELYKAFTNIGNATILATHIDPAIIDIHTAKAACNEHIKQELTMLEQVAIALINRMPLSDSAKYADINHCLDNLRAFRDHFSDALLSQHAISLLRSIDGKFEDALQSLSEEITAQSDVGAIAEKLIKLKQIGLLMPVYLRKVNDQIDSTLLTLSKVKDGAQKLINLSIKLRKTEIGDAQDAAIRLINEHTAFESQATFLRNEEILRSTVQEVLSGIREGYDPKKIVSTSNEVKLIKEACDKHKKIYWDLVDKGLVSSAEFKIELVKKAKQIAADSHLNTIVKLPGGLDYYIDKVAKFSGVLENYLDKIVKLSAHLFAYWTLDNSEGYLAMLTSVDDMDDSMDDTKDSVDDKDDSKDDKNKYLLQPHAAQIISIFRLLGIDVSGQDNLQNQLIQIGTGEGKSVTLAISAAILALLGYEVDCACYSRYLSQRDYTAFISLFRSFGVTEHIHYGTFNELCETMLNQHGDIRDTVTAYVKGADTCKHVRVANKRDKVLLIDEVDVFFSSDFYGNAYRPVASVQDKTIFELISFIWDNRHNQHMLKFENIQKTSVYTACMQRFSNWTFLIEVATQQMLSHIQQLDTHDTYKVIDNRIGYKEHDSYSFNTYYGYLTMFAYFKEHQAGNITQESRDQYVAMTVACGVFAYAEIPKRYQHIMGVTGTLETLSEEEKAILKSYNIQKLTYMPSVYGKNQLKFAGDSIDDLKIEQETGYYTAIANQIKTRRTGKQTRTPIRPVLVFFEDRKTLEDFSKYLSSSQSGIGEKVIVINEQTRDDEKEGLIAQAVSIGSIALLTRAFGRGTDFKYYDQRLKDDGGVHVIQTFFSELYSEEIQIKGRTARQGNKGSYSMVLCEEALERLGMRPENIAEMRSSGKLYSTIDMYRKRFFTTQFSENTRYIDSLNKEHEVSQQFIDDALVKGNVAEIKAFLRNRNQLTQANTNTKIVSRTLCLMDATGSMSNLLQKAKNTVSDMFEKATTIIKKDGRPAGCFELQFAVYRNYNVPAEDILVCSPWESNPDNLRAFMDHIGTKGGLGNEAIEIGLWHANREASSSSSISQVILIGDQPPNTVAEVTSKRADNYGEAYWGGTEHFKQPTHADEQVNALVARKIPVHTFYVDSDAEASFREIAQKTGGRTEALDIHSEAGARQLTELVTTQILNDVGGEALVKLYHSHYGSSVTNNSSSFFNQRRSSDGDNNTSTNDQSFKP